MAEQVDEAAIIQFCSVTNADPSVALTYLAVSDGVVEQAITLFLESGGVDLTPMSSQSISPEKTSARINPFDEAPNAAIDSDAEFARLLAQEDDQIRASDSVRPPIAPRREVLVGEPEPDEEIIAALLRSRRNVNQVLGQHVHGRTPPEPFRAETAHVASGSDTNRPSRLDTLFRPPLDIMHKGDFEKARLLARNENRWLMVNIQDSSEFACFVLNRDLWSDSTVKDVIRADFYFLQFDHDHPEGRRYTSFYPIENYPHIAIIDPRTGERIKVWSIQMSPTEFIMAVTDFLERYSLSHQPKPQKPAVKDISDMTEEEQINAAMQESLHYKTQETPSVIEVPSEHESPDLKTFNTIKPIQRAEPSQEEPAVTKIQFRLADGSRIVRRFRKSDPVLYLYEYIKSESVPDQPFELVFNQCVDKRQHVIPHDREKLFMLFVATSIHIAN
ncbi:hypothetical protein G9A89_019190 [Geosiphon pyriformis]|nr:hypothetical protein G9A89_019190 [Geosiphon pyriformis]